MTAEKRTRLLLPALRGIMGDWVYYSCLMSLNELSSRVDYARDIHKHARLSEMIQRRLDGVRSVQIADYLKEQPQRFFNSLVVATYGGSPNWYPLEEVRDTTKDQDRLHGLTQETVESVGFLELGGDEKLFALDGQHRLAGIKRTIKDGIEQDPYDEVSIIFVGHEVTSQGLERTRRLFTTLNKTARPVSKGDIIALDEDDVMAICVRRLIEDTDLFADDRIAFVATNNMPARNRTSLTTIGNLYDVLTILFTNSAFELKRRKADLQKVRPEDAELEAYFDYAKSYFDCLRRHCDELEEFFTSSDTAAVVSKYRGPHGGNALFRPIGLEIYARIIAGLTKSMTLDRAVRLASRLPRNLDDEPYVGLMWDRSNGTILGGHKVTLREILLYMIGRNAKSFPSQVLLERYRRETGNEEITLPRKLLGSSNTASE